MFCNQCEQTARGTGCVERGVCGKDEDVQSLQEILLYGLKGMCSYAHHARRLGMVDEEVDAFVEEALFATVTTVNFDLEDLLEQTRGTGINVYTHGEMLPAHMYPELRKHPHLVGHYGGAWQKQKKEFAQFNGAVLGTTNCVLIPRDEYKDRLFTTRVTAVPGGARRASSDLSEVIECAKRWRPPADEKVRAATIGFHSP